MTAELERHAPAGDGRALLGDPSRRPQLVAQPHAGRGRHSQAQLGGAGRRRAEQHRGQGEQEGSDGHAD